MKPKLTKMHRGTTKCTLVAGSDSFGKQGTFCEYEYLTEMRESEVIFQASVKINLKTKKGKALLKKVIKKQSSPIKMYLQEYDNENRRWKEEGKPYNEYIFPDEIIKLIEED